ncbi:MAG: hypothetical protein ACK48Y_09955, partial [Planctomyces sp.]
SHKLSRLFPNSPAREKIRRNPAKDPENPVFSYQTGRSPTDLRQQSGTVQQTEPSLGLTSETPTVCYGILRV